MNKTITLKTSMRLAFENVKVTKDTPTDLAKKVINSLQKNFGVIHRKRMWAVIRG